MRVIQCVAGQRRLTDNMSVALFSSQCAPEPFVAGEPESGWCRGGVVALVVAQWSMCAT